MAVAIRNDKAKGRFIRFKVDGVTKSEWFDAFEERIIPELESTDKLANREEKLKTELAEKFENTSSSLKRYFYEKKGIVDLSEKEEWLAKIEVLGTSYVGYVYTTSGDKNFTYYVQEGAGPRALGTTIYSDKGSTTVSQSLLSYDDGDDIYSLTLSKGVITKSNISVVYESETIVEGAKNYTIYIQQGDSLLNISTQTYTDDEGTTWSTQGTYEFAESLTTYDIVINKDGIITSVTAQGGK